MGCSVRPVRAAQLRTSSYRQTLPIRSLCSGFGKSGAAVNCDTR